MRARAISTFAVAAALVAWPAVARADDPTTVTDPHGRGVWLDAPLVDFPFVVADGPTAPSMMQSLALTSDLYSLAHFGIGQLLDPWGEKRWKRIVGQLSIAAFDAVTYELPFFAAWQHEEWHRAVMSNRQIGSYDEIYDGHLFSGSVSVSHETDRALQGLTDQHPAEAVHLYEAGIEGNYELATNLEKIQFFHRTRTYNGGVAIMSYVVNTAYWNLCTQVGPGDVGQPSNPTKRDFVGPDCTGWAYDLFHPGQPYAARGLDPNGGIQRYQTTAASGTAGKNYLNSQFVLSFLNFLDPNVFGFNAFTIGKENPTRFNAHVRHEPTSFGTDTAVEVFFQRGDLGLFGGVHTYMDRVYNYRPGLSAEIIEYPLKRSEPLAPLLTMRADAWVQPSTTNVTSTGTAVPGGRLQIRLTYHVVGPLDAWLEGEGKTAGWAAGSVALEPAVVVRAGVSAALFR